MPRTSRRSFLRLAGVGAAAVAAAAVPAVAQGGDDRSGRIAIRAIGGVPSGPLPSYATFAIDGYVDPVRQTGMLTRTVLAGHPTSVSGIALPGLSRTMIVTKVQRKDSIMRLSGTVADRSQLLPGESAEVDVWIDETSRVVRARTGANEMELRLEP